MSDKSQAVNEALSSLAEDARALMSATSDVAGEKVSEARKRLAVALENSKQIYGRLREKAIDGAKATLLIKRCSLARRGVFTSPLEIKNRPNCPKTSVVQAQLLFCVS